MKVSESKASILLAVILNGADQGDGVRVPERRCDTCGNFLVRFETSPGIRASVQAMPTTETCVTTSGHGLLGFCPQAARAKPLLDALRVATRRPR